VEALACLAMRAEAAAGNPDGIRRRLGILEDALGGEELVSAETQALARELLAPKRRPGATAAGPRAVPDPARSATAG